MEEESHEDPRLWDQPRGPAPMRPGARGQTRAAGAPAQHGHRNVLLGKTLLQKSKGTTSHLVALLLLRRKEKT